MGFIAIVGNDVIVTDTTNYRELSGHLAPCNQHHWFTDYGIFMPASYESIQIMEWFTRGDKCIVLPPHTPICGVLFTHGHYIVIDIVAGGINNNGTVLPSIKSTFVSRPIYVDDDTRDIITPDETTRNAIKMILEINDRDRCIKHIEKLKALHPDMMQKFKTTYHLAEIMKWCSENKDKIKRLDPINWE